MYKFIYEYKNGERIEVSLNSTDVNIYELGELFGRFLQSVGFCKENVKELFGLDDDEELPIHGTNYQN